ncbi:MAG TPA: NAD(P)H-dependent glycerol-3-phosphate dehydrogenase [Acetobacteraceae bacterium]|jgi:glycerol-3-phosphate dehydrogenase (NAD(P)+)|nr:NAD(P)H-dependent glycerol-3-phosphate dehydrogenase [Acetobacteraceae bacterium]
MSNVLIVGAGAWGTALAIQAARAGQDVALWARNPARAHEIGASRENPRLPGVRIPESVSVVDRLPASELILLAVPLQHMREISEAVARDGVLVCCAKGIETGTNALPLEILGQTRPGQPAAMLTGPNFAHEIARGLPAGATVAAADPELRAGIIRTLATPAFRLYGNEDAVGAQVGAAAKNVIAIAAGAVIGAGLGENARAGLVTRGLAEIARLAHGLGGRTETVSGLSGLGDLVLTCAAPASRNYSLGLALGRGESLDAILASRSAVTEGVATGPALVARARTVGVAMPICEVVADLVTGQTTIPDAMNALLSRPLRDE